MSASPTTSPTVTHAVLRRAIPPRCFELSTARACGYLLGDVLALAAVYALWLHLETLWLRPVLWLAAGTLLFSLYVIGHDCGHGSFSRRAWLNELVGQLTNALVLVPYHSWRISHRIHHRHVGDADRDEGWHPVTESACRRMPWASRLARFRLVPLVFPLYLLRRSFARRGSHYHPRSPLFRPEERSLVKRSLAVCTVVAAALVSLAVGRGVLALLDLYVAPYLVFVAWISVVTYLHHTHPDLPWYRGAAWTPLRGALATVDRDYGVLAPVTHHIGLHVVHHLFPSIPHYRLREATAALEPVLGERYRRADAPVLPALARAMRECRIVPDEGAVVTYGAGPPRDDGPACDGSADSGRSRAGRAGTRGTSPRLRSASVSPAPSRAHRPSRGP